MGLPHTLLKIEKPEVFELGKGAGSRSWMPVLDRNIGNWSMIALLSGDPKFEAGNFLEPLQNLDRDNLVKRLKEHDGGYSGDPEIVADRIIAWMGDDACVLCNGWEEMEDYISRRASRQIQTEFSDTAAVVKVPLIQYRVTGSIWK